MSKHKTAPAAKFLLVIAGIVVLLLIGGIVFTSNEGSMMKFAFVPSGQFDDEVPGDEPDYANPDAWAVLPDAPGMAAMKPEGVVDVAMVPEVDVFYVHPTTYLNKATWNAPVRGNEDSDRRLDTFSLKHQASAFNAAGRIYAPRYRQATFGSFFDQSGQGLKAIWRAHGDVLKAFDYYIQHENNGRPFILVGHSQGALHSLLLLAERIAPTKLKNRMVAAYIIGWPVSMEGDLDALPGIEACEGRTDTGCVVSFQSFADGGDPSMILAGFDSTPGLNGQPHLGTQMLCTNPLNWKVGGKAAKAANKGAVALTGGDATLPAPLEGLTGARCGADGILYLSEAPQGGWREYVMTGDNYHVYDFNLFYMNIRENAAARAAAWLQQNAE